jgi:serine/threonine-protein kinase
MSGESERNESDAADKFFDLLDHAVFSSPSPLDNEEQRQDIADPEFQKGDNVGHYRIDSLIGRGGMGTVYRAYDMRLNRYVALKFIPPQLSAEPQDQETLLGEARAIAALDHPNVCSIHEVGETDDGRLFIAMPYYGGETLKERMRRGPLTIDESLSIAVQIGRGLAAAHGHNIIHRDVKPANVIILPDGSLRLFDFGLAMVTSARRISEGGTPGTVAYMSPEQIRGDELSHPTDLWSLGVLLYEMLCGARPFSGANRREVINSVLHDDAAPITHRVSSITPVLAAIVDRLLEKDPANRYASASAVQSDLENVIRSSTHSRQSSFAVKHRPLIIAGALLLIAITGLVGFKRIRSNAAFQSRLFRAQPSLAVLPLTNLGTDSSDAALAAGITEDLIATLASTGDIRVIASTSTANLKRRDLSMQQIADTLGVGSILEGGLRKVGSQVRLQVQLIDGKDGSTRWSQSFDREFSEMFSVQDAIVRAVAAELDLRFDRDRQFVRHRARNVQAYELYLRASDPVLLRSQSGIWKSQDLFQQALAVDPSYAAAHAGLAIAYLRRARQASDPGMPVPQLMDLAKAEARKAIALDSTVAEGHYALGRVQEATLDLDSAEVAIRRAIELDPNRSVYRRAFSYLQAWNGHPEKELEAAKRALETDPLNPYAIGAVASGMYGQRRYDEALAHLEPLMTMKPPLQGVSFAVAQCYAKKKMWDKAIATLRPGAEAGDPLFKALLANFLAKRGQREEATTILADLTARRERTGVGAFHIAIVHAGFGDRDETFAWLDKSIDDRSIGSFIMGPTFEELHNDPRFAKLRRRLGFDS